MKHEIGRSILRNKVFTSTTTALEYSVFENSVKVSPCESEQIFVAAKMSLLRSAGGFQGYLCSKIAASRNLNDLGGTKLDDAPKTAFRDRLRSKTSSIPLRRGINADEVPLVFSAEAGHQPSGIDAENSVKVSPYETFGGQQKRPRLAVLVHIAATNAACATYT